MKPTAYLSLPGKLITGFVLLSVAVVVIVDDVTTMTEWFGLCSACVFLVLPFMLFLFSGLNIWRPLDNYDDPDVDIFGFKAPVHQGTEVSIFRNKPIWMPPPSTIVYYYADADKKAVGPYSLDQIYSSAARGIITLTTKVICKGDERWEEYKDKYGRLP